jgi:hypothetical protein
LRSLRSRPARLLEPASLLLILALAAYLRLARLADNPAWYTDEGTHVDIAQRLLQGRAQYLALTQSTLLAARMPLGDKPRQRRPQIGVKSSTEVEFVGRIPLTS